MCFLLNCEGEEGKLQMESRKSSSSSWPWSRKSTQTHTHVSTASPNYTSQKQETETASSGNGGGGTGGSTKPNFDRRTQSLSESLLNKNLVQQHAKLTEEAVSGRQKAEADGARYKKQLEETVEEKERLHKCMTEEYEAKCVEWDTMRRALESKVGQVENQLFAAEALNTLHKECLDHITQVKIKAESEVQSLYVKMSSLFKENSRLKYELHLLNKERQIRSDEKEYRRMAAQVSHKKHHQAHSQRLRHKILNSADTTLGPLHLNNDLQVGTMNMQELTSSIGQSQLIDEVQFEKEEASAALESHLQVLKSASSSCDIESNLACKADEAPNDADELSCAQSWASAMIAELDHFRKDKSLILHDPKSMDLGFSDIAMEDYLTEAESIASCSEDNKARSLKEEIEVEAAGRKQWNSRCAKAMIDNNTIASRFSTSITEILELVEALAHPLLYSITKLGGTDNKKSSKFSSEYSRFNHNTSELSESDLQLHIEKLAVVKEKAVDLGGNSNSNIVSWTAVDFLEELVGVLNRLVKIALYRNDQRDEYEYDDSVSDMSGLASVSQNNYAVSFNDLPHNPLPNHFLSSLSKNDQHVTAPQESKDILLRKQVAQAHDDLKMDFNQDITSARGNDAIQETKPTKKREVIEESGNSRRKQSFVQEEEGGVSYTPGHGHGHGHPSVNSKHLITPANLSSSSNSKLFEFNSKYIKSAIRSTISKTRSKSNNVSSTTAPRHQPHTSNTPHKLLNRLLSFS